MENKYFDELLAGITKKYNFWLDRPSDEEHMAYLKSDANLEICKPHILECERLARIINAYAPQLQALKDKASQEVVTEEYGTGGEILHRGFYCPSPVIDIVIGKGKRGKVLRRMTKKSRPTYRYGFNADEHLSLITDFRHDIDAIGTEIIIREEEKEIGIGFQEWEGKQRLEQVSECVYCGDQLSTYTVGQYFDFGFENRMTGYRKEAYVHSDEGLHTVYVYDFMEALKPNPFSRGFPEGRGPSLGHLEYKFKHEGGYLSQFAVVDHPGSSMRLEPIWDGLVYDIRIKRKV